MFDLPPRPLILSPAGSFESLIAAADSGADEIYFGLSAHNARQNAKNFTPEETAEALKICRLRGIKSNITLNTLVTDREIPAACRLAYDALTMGADAFIVQDIGLAAALKKAIPEIVLHASTQCACHSADGAKMLAELGFERVVLARELGAAEIKEISSLGVETEIFVHGALCVCHSGMCLMSSVIGKRSGNRGLCAQPCRLPYNFGNEKAVGRNAGNYPLSLKDLSLSRHISELSELGVASLKIEGRMKPPEYVAGVTSIWKKLVCENRNASDEEYEYLEKLFSRSGFTDGYFTQKYRRNNSSMYGVRTENDKRQTKMLETQKSDFAAKRSVKMNFRAEENKQPTLTISCDGHICTAKADFEAQTASSRPMTEHEVSAALSKLGGTNFVCESAETEIHGNIFIPKSQLNELRRNAVSLMEEKLLSEIPHPKFDESALELPKSKKRTPSAPAVRIFASNAESLKKTVEERSGYETESVCVPLGIFASDNCAEIMKEIGGRKLKFGVKMPRVLFSSEKSAAAELLAEAKKYGASYALAENIGQIPVIRESGLELYTGTAMNVFNSYTRKALTELGAKSSTLSPELLTAQMRDLDKGDALCAVPCSGRLELMVLESCVIKAHSRCRKTPDGGICGTICDRTGTVFPIKCERRLDGGGFPCRNIVLNSVPLKLIDKKDELAKTGADIYCIYED